MLATKLQAIFGLSVLPALLLACGDEARRPIGSACGDDSDCASGLCVESVCLDPGGDEDGDGLTNGLEAAIGTSPTRADSDGDGVLDPDELGPDGQAVDGDGDGLSDAVESTRRDADGDCIPDQYDARNDDVDDDMQFLVPEYCPSAGVCGEEGAPLRVVCSEDADIVRCDLSAVQGVEEGEETSCDGLDNDCDGAVDEGLGPNGDGVCEAPDPCAADNGGCEGTCANEEGVAVCGCAEGYALGSDGKTCEDEDECLMGNGGCEGTCQNSDGGFLCLCAEGFVLADDGLACDDVDECEANNGGCEGACSNTEGGFTCGCLDGFELADDGSTCNNIDECETANGGCSQICNDTDGAFECACDDGYALASDGTSCENINECDSNNGGCSQVCNDTDGSFECACNSGYALATDGTSCDNVNECDANNGGCSQICNDSPGSFECACNGGYALAADGTSCNNINECNANNGGCSQICNDSPGSFECACNDGYALGTDGTSCNNINECNANNGGCEQICNDSPGSFSCACDPGYNLAADGRACVDINECASVRCANGGTCVNLVNAFRCDCAQGYEGELCETPICAGGCGDGACVAPDTCNCEGTGFEGDNCEIPVCAAGCANGTCTAPNVCECDSGWAGPSCDGLLVFVSSTGVIGGQLGTGGTGDDAFARASRHCRELASIAGYEGDFVGWISTRGQAAIDQLPATAGPYFRPDGVKVAGSASQFGEGTATRLEAPINVDERGERREGAVLTGTFATGRADLERNCGEWKSTTASLLVGDTNATDLSWTEKDVGKCDVELPIYCMQIPQMKRIFLSFGTHTGAFGGLGGADEICQRDAEEASLPGSWRAWLSTAEVPARERLDLSLFGYRNMNGEVVATTFEGLLDRGIDAAIQYFANGERVPSGTSAVWTGTATDGLPTSLDCGGWLSTRGNGTAGLATLIDTNWTAWGDWSCANASYLYCVEQ